MSAVPWQCLEEAFQIQRDSAFAAEADAGFDAGEFSGPVHDEMLQRQMEKLAARYDVDVDDLWSACMEAEMMSEDEAAGYGDSQTK